MDKLLKSEKGSLFPPPYVQVHCVHSPVETSKTGNPSQFLSSLRNEQWRQELVIIVPDEKFGS